MSGFPESSQLMSVKEEEDFDDFLQVYLSAAQKEEETLGHVKIEDEDYDLKEYGHNDSSPTGSVKYLGSIAYFLLFH